ncbi:MAG: hypothetical protein EOP61_15180, partial [Sphingomonadales bacterium]
MHLPSGSRAFLALSVAVLAALVSLVLTHDVQVGLVVLVCSVAAVLIAGGDRADEHHQSNLHVMG